MSHKRQIEGLMRPKVVKVFCTVQAALGVVFQFTLFKMC